MKAVLFRWPQPFHSKIMTGWCGIELKKKKKRKGYFP